MDAEYNAYTVGSWEFLSTTGLLYCGQHEKKDVLDRKVFSLWHSPQGSV